VCALSKAEKEEMKEREKKRCEEKRMKTATVPRLNGNTAPTSAPAPTPKGQPTLAIQRCFALSSALKGMLSIWFTKDRRRTIIAVKGAPESIRGMLRMGSGPSWRYLC
jgi:magnesium-transporting ATPase (P-type)